MADSKESLEELLATERTPSRFPNAGDDTDDDEAEDANEEAGLAHALATRTPGPKMRRGEVDPLHLNGTASVSQIGAGACERVQALMWRQRWAWECISDGPGFRPREPRDPSREY